LRSSTGYLDVANVDLGVESQGSQLARLVPVEVRITQAAARAAGLRNDSYVDGRRADDADSLRHFDLDASHRYFCIDDEFLSVPRELV
jgi:hypothetical protein